MRLKSVAVKGAPFSVAMIAGFVRSTRIDTSAVEAWPTRSTASTASSTGPSFGSGTVAVQTLPSRLASIGAPAFARTRTVTASRSVPRTTISFAAMHASGSGAAMARSGARVSSSRCSVAVPVLPALSVAVTVMAFGPSTRAMVSLRNVFASRSSVTGAPPMVTSTASSALPAMTIASVAITAPS